MKYSVSNMADYIKTDSEFKGGVALVLGSGLGGFTDQIENPCVIPYQAIPNYPQPTVEGHSGEFVIGDYGNVSLIAAKGRFHYYEGFDIETVTLPIQLFHELGVRNIIITNAAGSVKKSLAPGSLMAINGYMDCTFRQDVFTPQLEYNVSQKLLDHAIRASKNSKIKLDTGVYCWTQGPGYETAAEIKYIRQLGGDAVGMSTVPELQTAAQLGIEALGISTITNYAAGIIDQPLTHKEVIETANQTKVEFAKLIGTIINLVGQNK